MTKKQADDLIQTLVLLTEHLGSIANLLDRIADKYTRPIPNTGPR